MALRRARMPLAVLAATLVLAAPAGAQDSSPNVQRIAQLPEMTQAIAINFIGETMFVSTTHGVYAYGIGDPAAPSLIGALPMYIWENEDMDVDKARNRLFISRDPRGFTSPLTPGAAFPYGAVHIIDVSLPHAMQQVGFFTLPAGHTTTCINRCDFIWTNGPYANAQSQPDFVGRPIYATDVRDPANPVPCPEPIDLNRNDGVTDYVHDVQVDSRGVAWVSGVGGVRGYWTEGRHRNPVTGNVEEASACKPVPYAGSGSPEDATPSRFMHNSFRQPGKTLGAAESAPPAGRPGLARASAKKKSKRKKRRLDCSKRAIRRLKGKAKRKRVAACKKARRKRAPKPPAAPQLPAHTLAERTLYATEENLTSSCESSGRFVIYDLEGTFEGQGFKDIATTKHRMGVFDTWTPENQEGSTGCASAHYFSLRGDGISANSFYGQGVRFLDVSDPRDIRQVGWYRPADADVWAPYWRDGLVYVADNVRGVDILKFTGSPRSPTVKAPALRATAATDREGMRFDAGYLGGLCPLPERKRPAPAAKRGQALFGG